MKGNEVSDQLIFQKQITHAEAILCELIINMNLSLSKADKLTESNEKCFQSLDVSMCLTDRIDEFWIAVSTKESDLQSLSYVMVGLLNVPHSSAAWERI